MKLLYINHTANALVINNEACKDGKYKDGLSEEMVQQLNKHFKGAIVLEHGVPVNLEKETEILSAIFQARKRFTELNTAFEENWEKMNQSLRLEATQSFEDTANSLSSMVAAITLSSGDFERYRHLHDVHMCNVTDKDNQSYMSAIWIPKLLDSEQTQRSLGWFHRVVDYTKSKPDMIYLADLRPSHRIGHMVRQHYGLIKKHELSISLFEPTNVIVS